MNNPFRTRKILFITPIGYWEVKVSFFGKIKEKWVGSPYFLKVADFRGQKYDGIIIDEVVKR